MGGKITLVKSVLTSMSIHTMMTLPIPETVIERIATLINGFIWDKGEEKRYHWCNFNTLCLPISEGGLGIQHPRHMMQSFHAKLAWKFINQSNTWAKYAAARFLQSADSSAVWKGVKSQLIIVRNNSSIKIGNGTILMTDILKIFGTQHTEADNIQFKVIKASNRLHTYEFLLPERIFEDLNAASISADTNDSVIWKPCPNGHFTPGSFRKLTHQPVNGNQYKWMNNIWRNNLPRKLSCFIWRLMRGYLPTDDNIRRFHSVDSGCTCCSSPQTESALHLFLTGDWAREMWEFLSSIFNRPTPRCLNDIHKYWLCFSKDFIYHLGSLTAVCMIWELWKARNKKRFENKNWPWKNKGLHYLSELAPQIEASWRPSTRSKDILKILGIKEPPCRYFPQWQRWTTARDKIIGNISVLKTSQTSWTATIVRTSDGNFLEATVTQNSALAEEEMLLEGCERLLNHPTLCPDIIYSSTSKILWFQDLDNFISERLYYRIRDLKETFRETSFQLVNPLRNLPAHVLACSRSTGFWEDIGSLPRAAQKAIAADRENTSPTAPNFEDHS